MEEVNRLLLEYEESDEEYEDYDYGFNKKLAVTPMAGTKNSNRNRISKCPYCLKLGVPRKEYDTTSMTWNMCGSICLLGC